MLVKKNNLRSCVVDVITLFTQSFFNGIELFDDERICSLSVNVIRFILKEFIYLGVFNKSRMKNTKKNSTNRSFYGSVIIFTFEKCMLI